MADPIMTPEMKKFIEDEVAKRLKAESKVGSATTSSMLSTFSGLDSGFKNLGIAMTATVDLIVKARDRAQQATDSIADLYKTGIVISSNQILQTADEFGVTFPKLTELLTKHSTTVAKLGIPTVTEFAASLKRLSSQGATFGLTLEELQDGGLQYLDILTLTGATQRYTTQELADSSVRFTKSLNEAAQVTGKSTEQIAASIKAKTEEAQSAFLYATMSRAQQENLNETFRALSRFNVGTGEAFNLLTNEARGFAALGISGLSDDFSTMLTLTGTLDEFAAAVSETDPAEKVRKFDEFSTTLADTLSASPELQIYQDETWAKMAGTITQATNQMADDITKPLAPIDQATKDFIENMNKIDNSVNTLTNSIDIGALAAFNNFKDNIAIIADGAAEIKTNVLIPLSNGLLEMSNSAGILTTAFNTAYKLLQDTFGTDVLPNLTPTPPATSRDRQDVTPTTAPPAPVETTPQPIEYEPAVPTNQGFDVIPTVVPVEIDLRDYIIPAVEPVPIDLNDYILPVNYELPRTVAPAAPTIESSIVTIPPAGDINKTQTDNTETLVATLRDTHDMSYQQMSEMLLNIGKMIAELKNLNTNIDNQTSTLKHAINDNSGVLI